MLLEVFIIHKPTAIPIIRRSFTKQMFEMDSQLFSGLISAIISFMAEMKMGDIQHFQTGNLRVLISPYEETLVVGVVEELNEEFFITNSIKRIAESFWEEHHSKFDKWTGEVRQFSPFLPVIDDIVYSEFTDAYISKDFPKHIVKVIRKFQNKFHPHVMRLIGKKAGIIRAQPVKNLRILQKKLTKEVNNFSICEIKEQEQNTFSLDISMCPICRGVTDDSFSCKFLEGFIEGYLSVAFSSLNWTVTETLCIAHGDNVCRMEIR